MTSQRPATVDRPRLTPIELALVAMLREASRTRAARRVTLTVVEGGKRDR